jgi:hypothetical protein
MVPRLVTPPRLRRGKSVALIGLALLGAAVVLAPADAAERDLAVGEVTSRVVRTDVDLGALVRTSLDHALHDLELLPRTPERKKHVVLSVALQDMAFDTPTRSVTCSVSVALRTARGGAMFATLEGRARVGMASGRQATAEGRAIDAAVRAALARVPEALH